MFVDNLVRITITQAATPVSATQTNVPLLISNIDPGWTDDKLVHAYGSIDELTKDGFDSESDVYAYATKLLGSAARPSSFLVARKAGATLAKSDLDAIATENNGWYAGILVKGTDDEILTGAEWFQSQLKMLFAASAAASIGDATSTSSLAATLKSKSYDRVALMWSPGSADKGIEAAWVGQCITAVPGTINWAYQVLAGISADALTTGQLLATVGNPIDGTEGNYANTYTSQYSRGVTLSGTVPNGSYIDITMGKDYLRFQMQAEIFSILASGIKVPFTNKGVAVFEAAVRKVLSDAAAIGLINPTPGKDADGNALPGITVSVADVGTLTAADRAHRRCPTINFTCTLSGCINAVAVQGVISI
jgi:hypothetical protein